MRDSADFSMLKGWLSLFKLLAPMLALMACSITAKSQEVENCSGKNLTAFNGDVYYCAKHPDLGEELFKSDGGRDTSSIVADIEAGSDGSSPSDLFEFNNLLFFVAVTAADGRALWSTDGTSTGTQIVKSMDSDEPANVDAVVVEASEAFYQVNDQLWRTDGTSDGTFKMNAQVTSLNNDVAQVTPNTSYHYSNGTLFYVTLSRLSRISSSVNSAELIAELPDNQESAVIDPDLSSGRDLIIFAVGLEGTQVWQSDGTTGGTELVQSEFRVIGTLGEKILACSPTEFDLVVLDGDTDSLLRAVDSSSSVEPCSAPAFASDNDVSGKLVFSYGDQLWSSDLTSGGTNVISPTELSNFALLSSKSIGGRLVFTALESRLSGQRFGIFVTDASFRGTRLLKREALLNSNGVSGIEVLGATANNVLFTIRQSSGSTELWRTDGNTTNTNLITEVSRAINGQNWVNGERLFFNFTGDDTQLQHTDGSARGTYGLNFALITEPPVPPEPELPKTNPAIYLLLLDDDDA